MNANNVYFNIPEIMHDGRFTDHNPNALLNNQMMQRENIMSNAEYRKYLQTNADLIIKQNQFQANAKVNSENFVPHTPANTNELGPYLFESSDDNSTPFGYKSSDLKTMYLSKSELQSKLYTPLANINPDIKDKYLNK